MCAMRNRLNRRPMTGPELLLGFVLLAIFIVVSTLVFFMLGADSPPRAAPLPWMAR